MIEYLRFHKRRGNVLSVLGFCRASNKYMERPGKASRLARIVFPNLVARWHERTLVEAWVDGREGVTYKEHEYSVQFLFQMVWALPTPSRPGGLMVTFKVGEEEFYCPVPEGGITLRNMCVCIPVLGYVVYLTLRDHLGPTAEFVERSPLDPWIK